MTITRRVRTLPARSLSRIGALLCAAAVIAAPAPAISHASITSEPAKFPHSEAKVVKQEDGTLLVDDKFIVKGEGTKEKPYVVTWDMLIATAQEFDPRAKKTTLPGRVMMLADKHVRIDGFVCFPLAIEQPRELLAMLNQWDGCCIGVPPTPYDAIEVRLSNPILDDGIYAIAGSVEGIFKVEPYLVGEWLVGLFMMEESRFVPKAMNNMGL